MAMRPIWKGALGFGLVNIPVSLYLAVESSSRTSFHLLHERDDGRIRYKRVCEIDGEEVPPDEIVKGYEYARGAYVKLDDEDLDSIALGVPHTIEILQFVDGSEVDPSYYERPYFMEPNRGAERAYGLLRDALVQSGKVGIGRLVFRERETLAAIRPKGRLLALETLRFAAQLRDASTLRLPEEEESPADQMELALLLVERLSAPWEPERYEDRYEGALRAMIDRKLAGLPPPEVAAPTPAPVIDLAEVLRQSLEAAQREEGAAPERKAAGSEGASASEPPQSGELRMPPEKEAARRSGASSRSRGRPKAGSKRSSSKKNGER